MKAANTILVIVFSIILSACGSTGVIQTDKDQYLVSVKNAKLGFVSAAEEKAEAYKKANKFCKDKNLNVETIKIDEVGSGVFQSASATLEFKCVE